MYRVQPFLKQVSRLSSRSSILSVTQPSKSTPKKTLFLIRASSTTGNSSFDDYDSIMRTKSCNAAATSSNYSSSSVDIDNALSTSASTLDDDISYASSEKICTSQVSYCPNTIDTHETAAESKEDYDRYELHHRPCDKTQVSYDTSWGLGLGW